MCGQDLLRFCRCRLERLFADESAGDPSEGTVMKALATLAAGGASLLLVGGIAAYALPEVTPKLEVRAAAVRLAHQRNVEAILSVPSSAADVRRMLAATGADDGSLDDASLRQALTSSITLGYTLGASSGGNDEAAGRVAVSIGGERAGELRGVGGVLYLQVDVPGLQRQFPGLQDGLSKMRTQLQAPTGAPAAPGSANVPDALRAPGRALLDGGWVSLDLRPGSWAGKQLKGKAPTVSAGSDLPQLLGAVGKVFNSSVGVRKVGTDAIGDHLVATLDSRRAFAGLREGLITLPDATLRKAFAALPQPAKVPDRSVSASLWVRHGHLTRVEIDLAQFESGTPAGHLVVRVDLHESRPITAPHGRITQLDLQALSHGVVAGMLTGGTATG
jgi:hypothetical protein